jgi:teichuronic acid biosynthesis glycosyltransferase TuaC
MESICVICSLYPSQLAPANQVFVQQFVWALADQGVACTVICPVAVNLNPLLASLPYQTTEVTENGSLVNLYFPKFISFGQQNILGLKTARITTSLFYKTVENVWKSILPMPQVIYGHFLTPGGVCASRISKKYGVASFAAYGESTPWSIVNYGKERMEMELRELRGIVAVSSANYNDLAAVNIYPMAKVGIFTNGIRTNHFYPRNKEQARARFGFDQKSFIVAFVGHFSERKGVLRVAEAVRGLDNVSVAFAGKGPLVPDLPNCIYNKVVKPEDIPFFLSAADVFVLPTLNEGCCNAIIEAMGCGLPVISSDLPFNAEILNRNNSILVDPTDIESIRNAILFLRDHPKVCEAMGNESLSIAKALSIESRARNIRSWIAEKMKPQLLESSTY